jgi:hypothetical protein
MIGMALVRLVVMGMVAGVMVIVEWIVGKGGRG